MVFKFKRQSYLDNFISDVKINNLIDSKKYWEFREFYSPGYFDYNKDFVKVSSILEFYYLDKNKSNFLYFRSKYFNSVDSIISDGNYIQNLDLKNKEVIFDSMDSKIFYLDNNKIKIIFLKTIDEMMKANGLFDYVGSEKKLLENKYWLNETEMNFN